MSSRRRFAGHARAKRRTDAKKVLEEREPFAQPVALQITSTPTGSIGPDTPTAAALPPLPAPTSASGGGSNDGGGNGNGGGSSSGGQSGGNGNGRGNGNGGDGNGGGGNSSGESSGAPSTGSGGTSTAANGGGSSAGPTSISPQVEPAAVTDAKSTSQTTSTSGSSLSPGTLSVNIAVSSTSSNDVPVATFSSGVAAGTGSLGGGNNSTGNENTSTTSQSHNLSAGEIGGIVIALFIAGLAILVVTLRRRAIARRVKRRELWFIREALRTGNIDGGGTMTGSPTATRSARSSFGTTFDQSQSPHLLPPIPLMAETRGEGPFVLNLDSSSLAFDNSRNSAGSNSSTASDPNAQFRDLPPNARSNGMMGPSMSVSPFSSSESYSFPRPPSDAEANRNSVSSYLHSNEVGELEDNIQTSIATSPTVRLSGAGADPFADPTPAETAMQSAFAEIQVIRRPFIAKLQDELIVAVGDSVRIVETFDDGWAMVQKIPPLADKKGKARAVDESDQGLIPIDCLREADQTLPEFVAQLKRTSGYAGDLDVNPSSAL